MTCFGVWKAHPHVQSGVSWDFPYNKEGVQPDLLCTDLYCKRAFRFCKLVCVAYGPPPFYGLVSVVLPVCC
jgi:hypothetical protein